MEKTFSIIKRNLLTPKPHVVVRISLNQNYFFSTIRIQLLFPSFHESKIKTLGKKIFGIKIESRMDY